MEQERYRDVIDAIANIAGWRAAHVEIRNAAEHRCHARQHLHDAKRIRESTWDQARLTGWNVQRAELLPLFTQHSDLGRRRFDRRLRLCRLHLRLRRFGARGPYAFRCRSRRGRNGWFAKRNLGGDTRSNRNAITSGRRKLPTLDRDARCAGKWFTALANAHVTHTAVLRNHQLENDLRRAAPALRIRHGFRRHLRRRDDLGLLCERQPRCQTQPATYPARAHDPSQFLNFHACYRPNCTRPENVRTRLTRPGLMVTRQRKTSSQPSASRSDPRQIPRHLRPECRVPLERRQSRQARARRVPLERRQSRPASVRPRGEG